MNAAEQAVLRALLDVGDFDGREALLAQVDSARVVGRCGCGCATIDVEVDRLPNPEAVPSPIPNQADVIGQDGERIGGVLVFVADGRLSMLEVYSNTGESIDAMPPVSRLDPYRLPIR